MNGLKRALLVVIILLPIAFALAGCKSTRRKWEDAKRYLLDDVVRW